MRWRPYTESPLDDRDIKPTAPKTSGHLGSLNRNLKAHAAAVLEFIHLADRHDEADDIIHDVVGRVRRMTGNPSVD